MADAFEADKCDRFVFSWESLTLLLFSCQDRYFMQKNQ